MKTLIYIFIILRVCCFSYFQTDKLSSDWSALNGKWECEKVILVKGKDTTDVSISYKPYFNNFYADFKYKDEYSASNTVVVGKYKLDKTKNKISFSETVETTKHPDAKVAVPYLVFKTSKQELYLIKLTANNLILLEKFIPNTEMQGDYIFYMKKIK